MGLWVNVVIHVARHGYQVVEVFHQYYYQVTDAKTLMNEVSIQRNVRFYFCLDCIATNDTIHMFNAH